MKLNISYLKKIGACPYVVSYYYYKYGDEAVDILSAFNETKIDWRVWFMGNAELDIVQHLINNGADVNASGNDGDTALMWASWNGHYDIAKLLIDHGADVNAKDEYGRTALMGASGLGHLGIVRLLLDAGADVNAKNNFGETALMYASRCNGHPAIIELLRSKGAKE
jgi:ankyrin repeat protein